MTARAFPVIPLQVAQPRVVCVVCEAPAHGAVDLDVDMLPVWSLADEDRHESIETFGFCRDCIARLADGDTLRGFWSMEYVPKVTAGIGQRKRWSHVAATREEAS